MKSISSSPYLPSRRPRTAGVALVIVLAFVVIITGVILAFFSQSLFTRQISDASASQAKADLLAQGAAESIIGDLRQEILLTSSTTTYTVGSGSNQVTSTIYTPTSPAYMLPQMSGTQTSGGFGNVVWAPNFLIRSASNQLFFQSNTVSIPTSRVSNVIAVSSTTPSLNGRSVSLTRWNSPYLLPLTGTSTDSTPLITNTTYFQAPDWVLVTRSGSSPASWNSTLANPSVTNSNYVIGRYAYTIYHEGGLIDANVAGYPTGNPRAPVTGTAQYGDKASLAYADLTQLPGGFYNNTAAVDQLVAWRNYSSAVVSGTSFQNPSFTQTATVDSGTNYYKSVVNNTTGYLTASGTTLNNAGTLGSTGQSDRMFGSRQELIDFLKNGLGMSGTSLSVLNYLATFTRGINQPAVAPATGRPQIQWTADNGGNSVWPANGTSSEFKDPNPPHNSDPINPAFLSIRVSGTFARNDGSAAILGEPFVKTRFALSRLAWLTYLGPSANRLAKYNPVGMPKPALTDPNYDLWALVNVYQMPLSYLQQGTATNIQNYFGLVWQVDPTVSVRSGLAASFHDGEYKWFYQGHNTSAQTYNPGSSQRQNLTGSISRLGAIAALGNTAREPDFFELLKATVGCGSLAKSSINYTGGAMATVAGSAGNQHPYWWQALRDVSLDYAVIQLGANIIDEGKIDGYSTRIVFDDGSASNGTSAKEFRGVQNLPYVYRVNTATMKLRMENPVISAVEQDGTLKDPGLGIVMHMPTIWNPYDENSPMGNPSPEGAAVPSNVGSASFRLIADAISPDSLASTTTTNPTGYATFGCYGSGGGSNSYTSSKYTGGNGVIYTTGPGATGSLIQPTYTLPGPNTAPTYATNDPGNSQLTFIIPNANLFREPTVLARPNLPKGSNLQMVDPKGITQYAQLENQNGKPCYQSGMGFLSDGANPLDLPTAPSATQTYLGICAGLFPIEWYGTPKQSGTAGIYRCVNTGVATYNSPGPFLTYRLQYKDPNPNDPANSWVTYDEKYTLYDTLFLGAPLGNSVGNLTNTADSPPGGSWQAYDDPRTARFSAIDGNDLTNQCQTPGGVGATAEWADQSNDYEVTDRPDTNAGYAMCDLRVKNGTNPFGPLFYNIAANGWTLMNPQFNGQNDVFRIGMLEQNNPQAADNGVRFTGDSAQPWTPGLGPMYYADADGIVRPAEGAYVPTNNGSSAGPPPASTTIGLPLATAYPANYSPTPGQPYQAQSRPYFLHRPFRSVAELGYVFSGTPWRNIDLFTSQSGASSLIDVFTPNETPNNANSVVAGVVNLNTQQAPVIQALLAGENVDEVQTSGSFNTGFYPFGRTSSGQPFSQQQWNNILNPSGVPNNNPVLQNIATTAANQAPLTNVSELVSRWVSTSGTYSGLIGDLNNLYSTAYSSPSVVSTMQNVDRFRETFIRPLLSVGQTRVWNLLIDVVAQTGRYPQGTNNAANFVVDGEQRYWVHVAIDRFTGQILDKQVEVVKN
jgi:Tfp pilus assembly protein PilX